MSQVEKDRHYTREHEWAKADPEDGTLITVGITDYAQEQLGDVVMVELPSVGDAVEADEAFGTVESPKSVSDLMAPVTGEIAEVNESLEDNPELVNEDPYSDGWLVRIRVEEATELDELMVGDEYERYLDELDEE